MTSTPTTKDVRNIINEIQAGIDRANTELAWLEKASLPEDQKKPMLDGWRQTKNESLNLLNKAHNLYFKTPPTLTLPPEILTRLKQLRATERMLSKSLIFSPSSLPKEIGTEWDRLSEDECKIINLRKITNAKQRPLTWREIAKQFQSSKGKQHTRQQCHNIYKNAMSKSPLLSAILSMQRPAEAEQSDAEAIKEMTSKTGMDKHAGGDLFNEHGARKAGVRITLHPRKPLNLTTSRRH